MNRPFFSIILPTRNRPRLLKDAISSVVKQNFEDYELIISDNSDGDAQKKSIQEVLSNPRVRYVHPATVLNIPAHWEFAAQFVRGKYILVLTDRSFFRQGTLKDVHNILKKNPHTEVAFWRYGLFKEDAGILLDEKQEEGFLFIDPKEALTRYAKTFNARLLPRPHLGCYRSDLVEIIRKDLGALYMPFGPDFTSSLAVLAYAENVIFIPRPLVYHQGTAMSSGQKAQSTIDEYLLSLEMKDPYRYVPIKAPINGSMIFSDFVKIKEMAGRNMVSVEVDWARYFGMIYQELWEKFFLWKVNKYTLSRYWREWRRALLECDRKFQWVVFREIAIRRWPRILKSLLRATKCGALLLRVKRSSLKNPTRHHATALEAGGFNSTSTM